MNRSISALRSVDFPTFINLAMQTLTTEDFSAYHHQVLCQSMTNPDTA